MGRLTLSERAHLGSNHRKSAAMLTAAVNASRLVGKAMSSIVLMDIGDAARTRVDFLHGANG